MQVCYDSVTTCVDLGNMDFYSAVHLLCFHRLVEKVTMLGRKVTHNLMEGLQGRRLLFAG